MEFKVSQTLIAELAFVRWTRGARSLEADERVLRCVLVSVSLL
jgi:hypothetical protein